MIYEYASVRVIFGSGILGFGFNLGQIESGRNRVGFKTGTGRVRSGCPFSGHFSSGYFGSGLN